MCHTQGGLRRPRPSCMIVLAAGLALAGCGGPTPNDPIGEWTGTLVTEKGSCPDGTPSRLLVGRKTVSFIPAGGVLVLQGKRAADRNRLHAQQQLQDMNHKPLPMVFEGGLAQDGSHIDGTYGTPSCRAHIGLYRPADHPLERALGN
ncbi:MAG: hypothetical protein ACRYGI_13070 [Janthinobacterium lividum]